MSIEARLTAKGERRYEVRLRDSTGREYSRTFRTRKDAERFENTELADRARGNWIDPRRASTRFADVAAEWLESQPTKKESSLARDRSTVDNHLLPAIGDTQIGQLTPADVQRLVNAWTAKLGPRTVRRQFAVLRAICNFAVDTDRIGKSPCRRIKLPEEPAPKELLVTPEVVVAIASALDMRSRPMVYLGAVLGLRWGEAAGLRVGDIDFATGMVSVAVQRTRGLKGRMVTGAPKWGSTRCMTVPRQLLDLLRDHIGRFGLDGNGSAMVCTSPDGDPLHYSNWRRREWVPACKAARVEGLTFHSLRTANATAMVALSVDVKTAQTRAGHKNALTTLNVYARATEVGDQLAAEKLGEFFLGGSRSGSGPAEGTENHVYGPGDERRGNHDEDTGVEIPCTTGPI
jgi:integrase